MGRPASSTEDILLYILAIFVPPVSVLITDGCGSQFCLNILLWFLIWIPAIIHAWWRISKSERRTQQYVAYTPAQQQHYGTAPPPQQGYGGGGYGTMPPPSGPPPPQQAYAAPPPKR